ncbi:hypothetical protein NQ314_021432 [Rhamnusium bicolor]|uniref:Peptidase C1A papain C-terminal domain-containing protein n=1 Tax=Rhamnusium bicolor TaxID=1586634 RepID=A0AAV8WIX9_9CUCU|nr:hypothetical protein NQ314_021432 [Rhamnusium bicolor]
MFRFPAMKAVVCLFLVAVSSALASIQLHPLSDEFINEINSKQSTWKAGRNFDVNVPTSYLKKLVGVLETPTTDLLPQKQHASLEAVDIPEFFDARDEWPQCDSVSEIRDQAACGSCWAFGAVEAMSDRICIHSGGKSQVSVSAEDLLTCCSACGYGCDGGYLDAAWSYWVKSGIVTGGPYHTTTGCRAYTIAPCAHHVVSTRPACSSGGGTPACVRECDAGTRKSYEQELTFGKTAYKVPKDVAQIQLEIMTNGPVEAAFSVYADFLSYKKCSFTLIYRMATSSGVYQHTTGSYEGGHAIRILGWGVEKNTPYWLVANSWNTDWGDNGYFKILRGSNHVGIEGSVIAGIPKL